MKKCIFIIVAMLTASCSLTPNLDMVGMFYGQSPRNDTRFEQSLEYNKEHGVCRTLALPSDNYKVYVATDMHVDSTWRNLTEFCTRAQADAESPFTLILGDVINAQNNYPHFMEGMKPLAKTWFCTAGNHDIYFGQWQQYLETIGSSTYWFVAQTPSAKDLFICLDSSDGTLGNDNYTNIAQFEVYFVDKTVNAVSAFEINSDSLFSQGEAQISVMAQNSGRGNFEGSFRLVLVNASLTGIVQELTVMEATGGLPHGGTAKVEFNGVITAPAGMYLLALQYSNGGDWSLAGSENHYNPVWVTVSEMQTGIDNPTASSAPKARKVIENGHVFIIVDDKKITLAGTRVK